MMLPEPPVLEVPVGVVIVEAVPPVPVPPWVAVPPLLVGVSDVGSVTILTGEPPRLAPKMGAPRLMVPAVILLLRRVFTSDNACDIMLFLVITTSTITEP